MQTHTAYLSVGSNLGDPLHNCCCGIEALCAHGSVTLVRRSPFYRTAPVDYEDQDWFLNAALHIKTTLTPHGLMSLTQAVQQQLGRKTDSVRFGPRLLDLDIIFYDALILDTPDLLIPHPRMHKRRFVLQPICDIDPTVVHPVLGQNVQDLLNQIVIADQDIEPCSFDC